MTKILGIDPGKTGALALLQLFQFSGPQERLLEVEDMPETPHSLIAMIKAWEPDIVVVEQVASRPTNSRPAAFTFGRSLGRIETAVAACGVRLRWSPPSKWKTDMGLSKDKDLSRARATERWPDWTLSFARKKDDGRAEAALIAAWHAHHPG